MICKLIYLLMIIFLSSNENEFRVLFFRCFLCYCENCFLKKREKCFSLFCVFFFFFSLFKKMFLSKEENYICEKEHFIGRRLNVLYITKLLIKRYWKMYWKSHYKDRYKSCFKSCYKRCYKNHLKFIITLKLTLQNGIYFAFFFDLSSSSTVLFSMFSFCCNFFNSFFI